MIGKFFMKHMGKENFWTLYLVMSTFFSITNFVEKDFVGGVLWLLCVVLGALNYYDFVLDEDDETDE